MGFIHPVLKMHTSKVLIHHTMHQIHNIKSKAGPVTFLRLEALCSVELHFV